jgi:D-alanyl-D-alanine carboxypeptidase
LLSACIQGERQKQEGSCIMEQNRPAPRRALSPKERRRRHRIRLVRNWTVFLLSCGAVMAVMTGGILWLLPRAYALIAPPTAFEAREYEGGAETDLSDKRLVLVNANLPLTEEPTPELAVADDATGVSLEAEAAAAYREMAEAAKQDEIELVLTAGYQDAAARQSAYEAAVRSCRESGCSEEEAAVRAATVQPAPEASEYATGYGADILAADSMEKDTGFADTRAYEWLEAYAAEHGFILRWPQERQAATGMVFEPWHWRYVGRDNALAIRASGLSLEEYLALEQTK